MTIMSRTIRKSNAPALPTVARAAVVLATAIMLVAPAAPSASAGDDLIVKESARSVSETIDTLQAALEEKGISVFGRVDHQANAKKAGLDLPPTMLLIFGNPKLGTPLMQANPKIGIDLPMKALAWQDADGKVWIGYTNPEELKDRHDIDDQDEIFAKMGKALGAFTDKAASK